MIVVGNVDRAGSKTDKPLSLMEQSVEDNKKDE